MPTAVVDGPPKVNSETGEVDEEDVRARNLRLLEEHRGRNVQDPARPGRGPETGHPHPALAPPAHAMILGWWLLAAFVGLLFWLALLVAVLEVTR